MTGRLMMGTVLAAGLATAGIWAAAPAAADSTRTDCMGNNCVTVHCYDDGVCNRTTNFDVRSTWEVRTAIYELLEGHDTDVVVDLTDVSTIDMTALRLLAVATRQATRDGHHLTLRGCGPSVRRMLHLSHLIRVVEVERAAAS